MVLPNPYLIDANAVHSAAIMRSLVDLAAEGQEGIRDSADLQVRALPTPGGAITVGPGTYAIKNTAPGAQREAYVGRVLQNEQVTVPPTDSSGGRTDLVIARIENPYTPGTGGWAEPADPAQGPYSHIRVITGVTPNIQSVKTWNTTWSAIPLARITRPASTGIVTQAHITDLRSMIDLRIERIVVITNPPSDPPPVAQQYWTESTPISSGQQFLSTTTAWTNYPDLANWRVPVPSWAKGMDINIILQPQVTGNVYGEMRLLVEGEPVGAVPSVYDYNATGSGGEARNVIMIGGTESLNPSWCGKVVTMRLQARSLDSSLTGRLIAKRGTRVNVWLNFKRFPVYSDGGT